MGTATFIPLSSIKSKPVDDSLRQLSKRAAPIIDILNFDKTYLRLLSFVR